MNDVQRHDSELTHEDLAPVWDAICAAYPLVVEHITGSTHHDAIGLEQCIRVFHAEAVRLQAPIRPDLLLAMLARWPDGAFAHRVGTELFAKDIGDLWQRCIDELREKRRKEAETAAEAASWLTISDDPWDEDALPPRPWLAPPHLMRGEITLLHGPGAAGKSQLLISWFVALALGKKYGRLQPRQRCRVLLCNFEDNDTEQRKRISAGLEYFDSKPADLTGLLHRVSLGPKADATMFGLNENGVVTPSPCWDALERACETIRPDAVALDPFVAINAVPENDNQLMRRVMTILRLRLARQFNCALALAHHDNKSGRDDEDSDQSNARGASDIVNAARFELAVKKMTSKQAEDWGIEAARRGFYFRVGSAAAKNNYTAPEDGEWFERLAVAIASEQVVRCLPWQPPSGKLDDDQLRRVVEAVERGTAHGPYSPQISNTPRSLAPVLMAIGITVPAAQRRAVKGLLQSGRMLKATYKRAGHGNLTSTGLRSPAGLPYNYEWCDGEEEQPF